MNDVPAVPEPKRLAVVETGVTPEKVTALLDALRLNPHIGKACRKVGISRTTLWRWRVESPELNDAVLAVRKQGFDVVEDGLIDSAAKGDTTAAIFLLKNNRREVYGDRAALEFTGKDGEPFVFRLEVVDKP